MANISENKLKKLGTSIKFPIPLSPLTFGVGVGSEPQFIADFAVNLV